MNRKLTDEQLRILTLIAAGNTDLMIAAELHYATPTAKQKAQTLCRKMGARNRAHLVAIAFRAGLIR